MDFADIERILELVRQHDLAEFEMEKEGLKLRVRKAVAVDGHFKDTSVSVLGQRRWVFLQGCVRSKAQSQALEKLVRGIDDVERVVNQLAVVSR